MEGGSFDQLGTNFSSYSVLRPSGWNKKDCVSWITNVPKWKRLYSCSTSCEQVWPSSETLVACSSELSTISESYFLKEPFPASIFFIFVFSIQSIVNKFQYKFCRWLDLNRGPLVSEATALPTEPQPLLKSVNFVIVFFSSCTTALCGHRSQVLIIW